MHYDKRMVNVKTRSIIYQVRQEIPNVMKRCFKMRCSIGITLLTIFFGVNSFYLYTGTSFSRYDSAAILRYTLDDDINKELSEEASQSLVKNGIRLLALDFDYTIVDVHTGGRWKDDIQPLCKHVRPVFRSLLPAVHRFNIQVAIVTFSPQVQVISKVMSCAFPDISSSFIIRGNDNTWPRKEYSSKGKQPHITSVLQEIQNRSSINVMNISMSSTLLIDDDKNNIKHAIRHGVKGIIFDRKSSIELFEKLRGPL